MINQPDNAKDHTAKCDQIFEKYEFEADKLQQVERPQAYNELCETFIVGWEVCKRRCTCRQDIQG